MTQSVSIELTGRLLAETTIEQALSSLAAAFKIDESRARQLLNQAPTVIKKELPAHQATQYIQHFAKMGVELRAIPIRTELTLMEPISNSTASEATAEPVVSDTPNLPTPSKPAATTNQAPTFDEPSYTPPWTALNLEGRFGRRRYTLNLIYSFLPCVIAALLLPPLLIRMNISPQTGGGWLLLLLIGPLVLWTGWQYFRCAALRLHDLNLPAYWAATFVLIMGACQHLLRNGANLSYGQYAICWCCSVLLPLLLAVWPGSEHDNLYGAPSEPPGTALSVLVAGILLVSGFLGVAQLSNSRYLFTLEKAMAGRPLNEQEVQVLFKAARKTVDDRWLKLAMATYFEETGKAITDAEAYRAQLQAQADAALLTAMRSLQQPLPAADLPPASRHIVADAEVAPFMQRVQHESGAGYPNAALAKRALQSNYDRQLRQKLGLPDPEKQ
ncbi:DUF805 domain-containing protein [Chitinibacter sp. ZOR0017]|uniref:DUF805 domain-containing protein n=1 Tax=Chitinibacter sp. ZOR0017 TaxID=1339254 RepID=UPI0009DD12F3|nr:DUF805 domain-containing protein [Chitinibacter sp. ZOR0017]